MENKEFEIILKEIQAINSRLTNLERNVATKDDIKTLSDKIDFQHTENINSDNLLLDEISALKEGVIYVNRKVADAEFEIHTLKTRIHQ
ncbi:MAG: hypothetical protein ACQEW4_12755 [Bacillota bacterium]|uniref:hypothetical protein n=1 Tax=Bacillus subtilis group TaxID=653685 RepID=UPI000933AA51|nr:MULTISPECIES: hypothetical protein [Bacillus subtilis group]MCY8022053.1 hypothetical protein [Bacillus licheniformis]OJT61946.1 hypothetical protein BFP49_13630 [Bacillus licheniformis]TWL69402.1 hypothetical protein CHCC15318_2144 [Bacillus licheniformis]TWM26927.1 hypothetical protein CHCC14821_3041 [Bacillus paralicheniformis]TWM84833.1 hypothetical protein CHCC14688_0789 [Bacillus licheniformis]